MRFCIVAARFNGEITGSLVQGAQAFFKSRGLPKSSVQVRWVPGAFELPVEALRMAKTGRYRAVVAVGCILEGETPHFAFLSQAALQGLVMAGVLSGVPVTCGVITAREWKQAKERSGRRLNRGREAAEAAWEMVRHER